MIDYVKILFKNIDVSALLRTLQMQGITSVETETGEILTQTIKLHFCTIRIYKNNTVDFIGSIHKMYNSLKGTKAPNYSEKKACRGYNGNTFTLTHILEVRSYLCGLFSCTVQQMEIQNLETGININTIFNPKLFVKGLLFHNGTPFEFRYKINFAQVAHQRYRIKIYSKSNQYEMKTNVLRIELKYMKSEELKKVGIRTFADINEDTLSKAKEMLLKRLNEVVYYDYTIKEETLTKSKQNTLNKYKNISYWLDKLEPANRNKPKKKLNDYIVNKSDNLKEQIKHKIIQKCLIINRVKKDENGLIINSFNIGLNISQDSTTNNKHESTPKNTQINRCKYTGLLLDLEDKKTRFAKRKTFERLKNENRTKFVGLSSEWLSSSKETIKEKDVIFKLCKWIFNKERTYNSREPKRIYKSKDKNQLRLF